MAGRASDISISVELDENHVPEKMTWTASDSNADEPQEVKAMLLALFDKDHLETLKVDLWTKEMQVVEMDRFFFNTLKSMADTYMRATGNSQLAGAMQQFAAYFGKETEILKDEGKS
jgi:gliding motility-associated protein GldC